MSCFPPGFDYDSLRTAADEALERLVLAEYSRKAIKYLAENYCFDPQDWSRYVDQVSELLKEHLPESRFIEKLREINYNSPMRDY